MASSRYLIASTTLSSSAASVTFSSIPSTYKDLVLKVSARQSSSVTTSGSLRLQFNRTSFDGTITTYSDTTLLTWNTSASSFAASNGYYPSMYFGDNAGGATANTFSNGELYIPNYTSAINKPLSWFGVQENNTSTPIYSVATGAGLWRDSSAITGMVIGDAGGYNFVSGSTFTLYGLKNS